MSPMTIRSGGSSARGRPSRVLIAGGGVAGLETPLGLHTLARDRVELKFVNRSMSVGQPFEQQRLRGIRLEEAATEVGARRVEPRQRRVVTKDRDELGYDQNEHGVRVETSLDLAAPDQGSLGELLADLADTCDGASAGSNRASGVKHSSRRSQS